MRPMYLGELCRVFDHGHDGIEDEDRDRRLINANLVGSRLNKSQPVKIGMGKFLDY